jgi:hypothetical protein
MAKGRNWSKSHKQTAILQNGYQHKGNNLHPPPLPPALAPVLHQEDGVLRHRPQPLPTLCYWPSSTSFLPTKDRKRPCPLQISAKFDTLVQAKSRRL